ncbi:MAG: hypothetical protein EBR82_17705 [Caulobacteraceae bacterium]|nr:hypothetical protein [Caulobacteraceae bacterium]
MTDRPPFTSEDEIRGLAFASYTLTHSLLTVLETKGILTGSEVQDVLDRTLNALEHRHQDNSIDIARRLIEGAIIARAASRSGD